MTEGFVRSVAFSPDGKTLAAGYSVGGGGGGGVVLWDVAGGSLGDGPLPVTEGPSERGLQPRRQDPRRRIRQRQRRWRRGAVGRGGSASSGRGPLAVTEGIVQSVAFSPDGQTLATGYSGGGDVGGVVLWDVVGWQRLVAGPLAVTGAPSRAWPSAPTARPSPPDTAPSASAV